MFGKKSFFIWIPCWLFPSENMLVFGWRWATHLGYQKTRTPWKWTSLLLTPWRRDCEKNSKAFDLKTPCRNFQIGKIFHQGKQNTFPTKWNNWLSSMSWSHNQQHMVLDSAAHTTVPALWMQTFALCRIGESDLRALPKSFFLHASASIWNCLSRSRCNSHPLHTEQTLLLLTSSSQQQWQDSAVPSALPSGAYEVSVDFGFQLGAADYSCLADISQQRAASLLPASNAVEEKMVVAKYKIVGDGSSEREKA